MPIAAAHRMTVELLGIFTCRGLVRERVRRESLTLRNDSNVMLHLEPFAESLPVVDDLLEAFLTVLCHAAHVANSLGHLVGRVTLHLDQLLEFLDLPGVVFK